MTTDRDDADREIALWLDARRTLVGWARLRGLQEGAVKMIERSNDVGMWVDLRHSPTPVYIPPVPLQTLFWSRRYGYLLGTLAQWLGHHARAGMTRISLDEIGS